MLFADASYAACSADVATGVNATGSDTPCTAALNQYNGYGDVMSAIGPNAVLNITGDNVEVTSSAPTATSTLLARNQGMVHVTGDILVDAQGTGHGNVAINADGDGSAIHLNGNTTVHHSGGPLWGAALAAQFGQSLITSDGTLTVTTEGGPGIWAEGGGRFVLNDIEVIIHDNGNANSNAIRVYDDKQGFVHYNNANLVSTGSAIWTSSGEVTSTGTTTITTTKNGAHGISANGPDSTVIMGGQFNAATLGQNSHGVQAQAGSKVALNGGGEITTMQDGSNGLLATGADSRITTATPLSIATQGQNAAGAAVRLGASISAETLNITTQEAQSAGVHVDGANSHLDIQKSIGIQTQGRSAVGVLVSHEGNVALNAGNIETLGHNAHGVVVVQNSNFEANDLRVSASGEGSSALLLSQANPNALPNDTQTVSLNHAQLIAYAGSAIHVLDGNAAIELNDTRVMGPSTFLEVGASTGNTTQLTASASQLVGAAHTGEGSTAALSLTNGTHWSVTGDSNVTHLNNTASTVALGRPDGFNTLTVDGNYTGSAGSVVAFNTVLGDDNSATDRLIVKGDTAGQSTVYVTNRGGEGAATSQGIQLIEVGGNSNAVFNLQGDYVQNGEQAVVSGAYAYKLYQGSDANADDGSWYLRSQQKPAGDGGGTDVPPTLYQAGVPSYEAYPQALLALNGLNTLHQRVGNRAWQADDTGIEANGVWLRIDGGHNNMEPKHSTSNTEYTQNIFTLQAGRDAQLKKTEQGDLVGGLNLRYTHGKTKTKSVHGDGEISTNGYGFGGTLTWYDNRGFYLDGQGQLTWYRSDLKSRLTNHDLEKKNDGFGYAFSMEGGKSYPLNSNGLALTPQAQLTYSHVDFDSFNDTFGARVSMDKGQSLQGRLGLMLGSEKNHKDANGVAERTHAYAIANLYYEFMGKTKVKVADTTFESRNDRVWGGLGVGGTYNWHQDKYSVYGEALIDTSLKNFGDSHSAKLNVGFRTKW